MFPLTSVRGILGIKVYETGKIIIRFIDGTEMEYDGE